MIKKARSILLLGFAVSLQGFAASPYVGVSGGITDPIDAKLTNRGITVGELEQKTGVVFEGVVGLSYKSLPIRTEFAFSRMKSSLETLVLEESTGKTRRPIHGEIVVSTLMANLHYDIETGTPFTPYLSAGAGGAQISIEIDGISTWSDLVFAAQAGGGIAYKISPSLSLDLSYKYMVSDSTSAELVDGLPVSVKYNGHTIQFGLRYTF